MGWDDLVYTPATIHHHKQLAGVDKHNAITITSRCTTSKKIRRLALLIVIRGQPGSPVEPKAGLISGATTAAVPITTVLAPGSNKQQSAITSSTYQYVRQRAAPEWS